MRSTRPHDEPAELVASGEMLFVARERTIIIAQTSLTRSAEHD
jgi:hypothetical protein